VTPPAALLAVSPGIIAGGNLAFDPVAPAVAAPIASGDAAAGDAAVAGANAVDAIAQIAGETAAAAQRALILDLYALGNPLPPLANGGSVQRFATASSSMFSTEPLLVTTIGPS
jgi:hypothetical protein